MLRIIIVSLIALFIFTAVRDAEAKPVSLADARRAPDVLRYVAPGGYARVHGSFSDVSAYRWNGKALGEQRRSLDGWSYWLGQQGRVWFSGKEFFNYTRKSVIVAGWRG